MESKWKQYTINDVCSVTDCQHKTAPTVENKTSYRMLRTANIRNGQLRNIEETKSVSKEIYEQWSVRGYLEAGDVILTREAPMGEVALLSDDEKYNYFLGQRMLQLKAYNHIITPEFLYYSLQTRELQHQIMMNEGTGSVVSNIRIPLLKKMQLSVPELKDQKKITKVLTDIDKKININNKLISNLEEISQTLFKHWFVDFEFPNENGQSYKSSKCIMIESELGAIPKDWKVINFEEIMKISSGKRPKRKVNEASNENEIPIIGASKLMGYTNDALYNSPILVIGRVGTHGVIQKIVEPCWPSDNTLVIESEFYNFVYEFLKRIDYKSLNRGSTQPLITQTDIKSQKLAFPKNSAVADKFESTVSPLLENQFILKEENQKLSQLRDTLLPKLLSGEIEIPDEVVVN